MNKFWKYKGWTLNFHTVAHYPLQKCKKSFNITGVWRTEYFEEVARVVIELDERMCLYEPSEKFTTWEKCATPTTGTTLLPKQWILVRRMVQVCKERQKRTNSGTKKADGVDCENVCCITIAIWNYLMFKKMLPEEDAFNSKKEQCEVVLFLVLLKKTPTEYYSMMWEAYGDQVMHLRQVFHWHKHFRKGRTTSVAVKQSHRPVSISTNVTLADGSSLSQHEIAVHLAIAKGITLKICRNCLIVIHNPTEVIFFAFVWMARTGAPFIRLTCNLGYFFEILYSS